MRAAVSRDETVDRERLVAAAREAFALGERLDWRSYDPFDLLLSPLGARVRRRSVTAARLVVQIGKRSGAPLRRALRVPPHEEPKAVADFLAAAVALVAAAEDWARPHADRLAARLRARAVRTGHGLGWGLGFPYASRFADAERDVPNVYVTTVAAQALLDHHELTDDESSLAAAVAGCRFVLDDLGWFGHRGRRWLRYWPGSDSPVVNVQASSAALLARSAARADDARLGDAADRAALAALAAQRDDGSWPYSDDGRAEFVDGFHTGFTLQGLAGYAMWRRDAAVDGVESAVDRGFSYFVRRLMTPDGLPRGVADGRPSLDGQNAGQCVDTLLTCGSPPDHRRAAQRVWLAALEGPLGGRGPGARFPVLRWTLGPAVLATAHLVRAGTDQPTEARRSRS